MFAVEMPVITVALSWNSAGFANGVLERSDRLLLRRGRARHVENFFLHDRAVKIVDAVTERDLRKRQSEADPIRSQMIDVVQINAAHGEIAKLLNGGSAFDVREHGRLRFKSEWNETAEAASFILKLAELAQMIDALFESLDVTK